MSSCLSSLDADYGLSLWHPKQIAPLFASVKELWSGFAVGILGAPATPVAWQLRHVVRPAWSAGRVGAAAGLADVAPVVGATVATEVAADVAAVVGATVGAGVAADVGAEVAADVAAVVGATVGTVVTATVGAVVGAMGAAVVGTAGAAVAGGRVGATGPSHAAMAIKSTTEIAVRTYLLIMETSFIRIQDTHTFTLKLAAGQLAFCAQGNRKMPLSKRRSKAFITLVASGPLDFQMLQRCNLQIITGDSGRADPAALKMTADLTA